MSQLRKNINRKTRFLTNCRVKGVPMISGGAIPKIYRFAESPDFPINPVKTQNKSCQTYKVGKEGGWSSGSSSSGRL